MNKEQAENVAKRWVLGHYFAETPEDALEEFDDFIDRFANSTSEEPLDNTEVWFVFEQIYTNEQIAEHIMEDVANLSHTIMEAASHS